MNKLVSYTRDKTGRIRATIVATVVEDAIGIWISIGWALCRKTDTPVKKFGRELATRRANEEGDRYMHIISRVPETIKDDVLAMADRANKYFRQANPILLEEVTDPFSNSQYLGMAVSWDNVVMRSEMVQLPYHDLDELMTG